MLNIIVCNYNNKRMEYEWKSEEEFIAEMENGNEYIPTLDEVLVEVNTDDDELHSWWCDEQGITVSDLFNHIKKR